MKEQVNHPRYANQPVLSEYDVSVSVDFPEFATHHHFLFE